jgi:hypothetical protein
MTFLRNPTVSLLAVIGVMATPAHVVRAEAAGAVADPGLSVDRASGGDVVLTWPGSCLAGDIDFEVYEGAIGEFEGHEPATCSTGGETTYTFARAPEDRFFLVVPRNATHEGSYGTDGTGAQRPQSAAPCLPRSVSECPLSVPLADIDSGLPSPTGNYRWMDVADQIYATGYRDSYDYTQADVELQFFPISQRLSGFLVAGNLKPHFAYQVKIAGIPGTPSNERIGLTGRWWQEEWDGAQWTNGQNLNDKGDGSSPNPNDDTYYARRDLPDAGSPTGRHYRYTGYLVFDYFFTDETGSVVLALEQSSSYHVLWKTTQRSHTPQDGPTRTAVFDVTLPDPVSAYDVDYPQTTTTIFGEWERLPVGGVVLPPGLYEADFILTEEAFHGSGLAGGWAAAMGTRVVFEIATPTSTSTNGDIFRQNGDQTRRTGNSGPGPRPRMRQ